MAHYRLFLIIFACLLVFSACSQGSGDLFLYRECPSTFSVSFPSSNGEVLCHARMDAASIVLTVAEPERSAGIIITCTDDSCLIAVDETLIPISSAAARSLLDMFHLLSSKTEGDLPTRSSDGEYTTVKFDTGSVTLDENLFPCAVECTDMNGDPWRVKIENFKLQNNSETPQNNGET